MPVMSWAVDCSVLPVGMASRISRSSTSARAVDWTSTSGAWPETVTVSSRAPTDSSTLTVAVKSAGRSCPSTRTVEKPGRLNVRL